EAIAGRTRGRARGGFLLEAESSESIGLTHRIERWRRVMDGGGRAACLGAALDETGGCSHVAPANDHAPRAELLDVEEAIDALVALKRTAHRSKREHVRLGHPAMRERRVGED